MVGKLDIYFLGQRIAKLQYAKPGISLNRLS